MPAQLPVNLGHGAVASRKRCGGQAGRAAVTAGLPARADRYAGALVVEATDPITRGRPEGVTSPWADPRRTVPPARFRPSRARWNQARISAVGDIACAWDAEDRPDPDQLHKVARARPCRRRPDVACLQGQLDYFNPRTNWLARCFTIEYAAPFRIARHRPAGAGRALGGRWGCFSAATLESPAAGMRGM